MKDDLKALEGLRAGLGDAEAKLQPLVEMLGREIAVNTAATKANTLALRTREGGEPP